MNQLPLISLVIPVYNASAFIKQCLESAVNQTYTNLEVVVVNDSSTDESVSIIKQIQKKHTNIILKNSQNGSAAKTRRDGVEASQADYICFLDADDVLDRKYVEYLYRALADSKVELSACYLDLFSELPHDSREKKYSVPNVIGSDAKSFADHYHITNSNKLTLQTMNGKLFKKVLFKNIDYKVIESNIFEDNFIMAQILQKIKKIGVCQQVLYWYRVNNDSISSNTISQIVNHEGRQYNSIEFFRYVVMEYCRRVLPGSNVDNEIRRLISEEMFMYAKGVPDLLSAIKMKDEEISTKDRRIAEITNSRQYRLGSIILSRFNKLNRIIRRKLK